MKKYFLKINLIFFQVKSNLKGTLKKELICKNKHTLARVS